MNLKSIWINIIILLSLFLIFNSFIVEAHSCTLTGNYYDCDTDNSISGDLNFYDKGVYIHDITITINGADGSEGSMNGVDGELSILTSGKVLIENSIININGGNGYSLRGYDGGNGGNSIFKIIGNGETKIINSSINLNGGNGGAGHAYCEDTCDDGAYGGYNGYVYIKLSHNTINITNSNITGLSGYTGTSDSHCSGSGSHDGQSGRSSLENTFKIDSQNVFLEGIFSLTGGKGGEADYCGDGRGGSGGYGGDNIIAINSTSFINNMTFFVTGGAGNDADAASDSSGRDGGNGGSNTIKINSNKINLNSNYICTPGIGGYLDAGESVGNDGTIGTCKMVFNSSKINIIGNITYETTSFSPRCKDQDSGTQKCNGEPGLDSIFIINSTKKLNFIGSKIKLTSTKGGIPTSVDEGNGGNGGDIDLEINSPLINVNNSNIVLNPADGRNADCSGSSSYINGFGGSIYSKINGYVTSYNSNISFLSGNSGQSSACTSGNQQAGNINIYDVDYLNINKTILNVLVGKNAPATSSYIGGYLNFTVNDFYSDNSKSEFQIGKEGQSNGKFINVTISNNFNLKNSSFDILSNGTKECISPYFNLKNIILFETIDSNIKVYTEGDSGTCNNLILANGQEFNFMNNTKFDLTNDQNGIGIMNITLSSSKIGLPGIMRWNYTEISNITTNVLSNQTSFNSTRGSVNLIGDWSWNNSVNNITYDNYFTRLQNIEFVKLSDDKGPEMYGDSSFTCKANVTLGNYLISTPLLNFTLYNNSNYFDSANNTIIINKKYTNSGLTVTGVSTSIGDIWNCSVKTYNNKFANTKSKLETIDNTYPYNVSIYIGNKNKIAGQIFNEYLKNATNITIDRGTINEYIQNNCSSFPCSIPLEFRSDTDAIINVSDMSFVFGVDSPLNTSTTSFTDFPIIFNSSREGKLIVSDLYFLHESDEQTSIRIKGGNGNSLIDHWIKVLYSKFTFNLTPTTTDYYDVYPLWSSQHNVQPFGQTSSMSIYNITRMNNTNHSFEIRIGIDNGTSNDCADIYFSEDNNINHKFEVYEGNYTALTNFTWDTKNNTQLWSWVDFNDCNNEDIRYFFPDFIVKAKAYGTVNTTGFWEDLK